MPKRYHRKQLNRYGKLVFTFPDGRKVFQIKDDYVEQLPAKKLLFIQENSNYIAYLGVSKSTMEAAHSTIKQKAFELFGYVELDNKAKLQERCNDIVKVVEALDSTRLEYDNTNETIMLSLFDLFFFFDNETPLTYSEQSLEQKRYYLNEYPFFRNFFFQKLNDFTSAYKVILQNVINFALIQTRVAQEVAEISKELTSTNIEPNKMH